MRIYRSVTPSVVLTHPLTDPYNGDHPAATRLGIQAQKHMWDYFTDLAVRRGVQVKRNAGPNLGLAHETKGEAYMRFYPQVTNVLE